jgi:hypothetical protein
LVLSMHTFRPKWFNKIDSRMHFDERYFSQMVDAQNMWKNEVSERINNYKMYNGKVQITDNHKRYQITTK